MKIHHVEVRYYEVTIEGTHRSTFCLRNQLGTVEKSSLCDSRILTSVSLIDMPGPEDLIPVKELAALSTGTLVNNL